MSIVKKKKHVSKKNKKDWRKHCDITDVEAFLEDQRLEERLGKFEAKPDSELFIIDTGGDEKPDPEDVKPISKKLQRRAKLAETPKCFEVLLPRSKVEDPNKKRNHVNPVGFKDTALSKITNKKRFEKGVYSKKLELAKKNRKMALEKKRKTKKLKENFGLDLWGADTPESKAMPPTLIDDFIPAEAQIHNLPTTHRLRPRPPAAATLAARRAVELPHAGVSYNPTFQEHQELLQQVVEHEKQMMKKEQHLNRVTTGMFRRITVAQKEDQWREEMSTLLPTPHNPSTASDSDTDNEYKAINPPVKNKKKDHKARRKQKEKLVEDEKRRREKVDKKKITDLYKLRKIQSSISTNEQKQQELRSKKRQKRTELAASAPPALNKNKITKREPDFVEPAQLTGDLRNIKSSTNLLRERFESLQHRGALAGSKVMMKKKRKVKSYFKPGHKVTDKDIEKYTDRPKLKK